MTSDNNLFDRELAPAETPAKAKPRKKKSWRTAPPDEVKTVKLPAAVPSAPTFIESVLRAAADPLVDPLKAQALINIVAESQFHAAMIEMDADLPVINKDGKIVVRGGKPIRFASFENINREVKPILRKHNFNVSFQPDIHPSGQGMVVRCELTHGVKGEPVFTKRSVQPVSVAPASPAMNAQQAHGAAIAYAKRYGIIGLLNLQTEALEDRDTDTQVSGATVSAAQIKKIQKAVADNEVPADIFKKYWLDPFEAKEISEIPADQADACVKSCQNYGSKAKTKAAS